MNDVERQNLAKHLKRFHKGVSEETLQEQIDLLIKGGLNKDQVFHELSKDKGKPPTHCSGKPEGDVKRS